MKVVHIVTMGTSIIRNLARDELLNPELRAKLENWAKSKPGSPEDVEAGEAASYGRTEFRIAYERLLIDPRRYSAELNGMWDYLRRGKVDVVHLISTDSGACEFCVKLIQRYLTEHKGVEVEVHRVTNLGRDFEAGLLNLVDCVIKIVRSHKAKGDSVFINATGGFKPETAVLYLITSLLGADAIYYIHETMRKRVELPTLPILLQKSMIETIMYFDNRLTSEVPRELLNDLERRGLVEVVGTKVKVRSWIKALIEV